MSAFAVKVSSDKQTLILAGEAIPPRADVSRAGATNSERGVQLQRVTMLLVQGEYAGISPAADSRPTTFLAAADSEPVLQSSVAPVHALPAPARSLAPYSPASRAFSAAAAEYARTQDLSGDRPRSRIIDTYA